MRLDDVEPLVGDDEGDVVAVREDALDERIVDRAAEGVAARLLHGVRPHLDVVLLLLAQVVRHAVGVDQRQQADDHAHGDHHDPVAERERIAVEQVFQRPACHAESGLFSDGILFVQNAGVLLPVVEQCDGAMHLAVLRERMLRNPLRIAVTQDDGAR